MDAVLNWIWQGSIVALAAAGMLRLLDPARADVRYRALWIVLAAILALPFIPLLWAAAPAPAIAAVSGGPDPVIPLPTGWWLSGAILLAAAVTWAVVSAARLLSAGAALRRARQLSSPIPSTVEMRLTHWCRVRATGRRTRLVVSDAVRSAAVLGGRSPVIAVAPALLDRLTDDELDRVVIHEWAHVQRRDDVAHLLQLVVRLVAGWHPAVRWCDRKLHLEREVACDRMAVTVTGSSRAYAACLARLASLPVQPLPPLQAVSALPGSGLHHRVVRILSRERGPSSNIRSVAAAGAPAAIGVLALIVGGIPIIGAVPAAAESAARALVDSIVATADVDSSPVRAVLDVPATGDSGAAVKSTIRISRARQASPAAPAPSAAPALSNVPTEAAAPPAGEPPVLLPSRPAVAAAAVDPPGVVAGAAQPATAAAETAASSPPRALSPWTTAADAGVAVGGGAQDAALATAGFFNRLGRKIADSF